MKKKVPVGTFFPTRAVDRKQFLFEDGLTVPYQTKPGLSAVCHSPWGWGPRPRVGRSERETDKRNYNCDKAFPRKK